VQQGAPSGWYSLTHRVRWRIFAFLFIFGAIAYFQQKGMTIAAERIMPELHVSQVEIGWLEWAFVLGYAAFQFPGGLLGQRFGARVTLTVISAVAFFATVFTPLAPLVAQGAVLFFALFSMQLLLGLAQGPLFPVSSGVMETWFPPRNWSLIQGLQSAGLQLAAAATAPLVVYLMGHIGWQQALFWPALPAAGVIALWAWYGRDRPKQHPKVSAAELGELGAAVAEQPAASLSGAHIRRLLTNRSVLLLTISYVCMNYVFYLFSNWSFLYLVQERHFSLLQGGWLATLPPLAAGVGAGVGGKLVAIACARFGDRWGFRVVPMVALPVAGLLLIVAVNLNSGYAAVTAMALAFAVLELTEGAFWGAIMFVGRSDTMAAGGVLNTGGNVGGLIGIPIVAQLSGSGHWTAAFLIGTAFALVGALLWLGIDVEQRVL
jgi:ACS family glucarate transporter-like MFS transporter